MITPWPFDGLMPMRYGAILADPPWSYAMRSPKGYDKSPEAHYGTMSPEAIKALPVGQLAGPDCLLFLWSTFPHLPLALEVMAAWGFTYKTGGAWIKRGLGGTLAFGTGYILRSASEVFLIGTIGAPAYRSRSVRNVIDAVRREHSRKPRCAPGTQPQAGGGAGDDRPAAAGCGRLRVVRAGAVGGPRCLGQ